MFSENFLTTASPPIPLRVLLVRTVTLLLVFQSLYIGPFSIMTQCRIKKLVTTFCSDLGIKMVFTLFQIRGWFGAHDSIPAGLRSRIIYKFSCVGRSACYIGETSRHFATHIREHLASDKHSHIFKHLRGSENCRSLCSEDCFKILDSASTRFQIENQRSNAYPLGEAVFKFPGQTP